jgi:cysteine-rich repeat protein
MPLRRALSQGLAISPDGGALYVADSNNHCIRRVDLSSSAVTTIAGTGYRGSGDGPAGSAQFSAPGGLAYARPGPAAAGSRGPALYVADTDNSRLRALDLDAGSVRTVAGGAGFGLADGGPGIARLLEPLGLAAAGLGGRATLFVADRENGALRLATLSTCGDGVVTGTEQCDDGNAAGGDGCSAACAAEPGFRCASVCRDWRCPPAAVADGAAASACAPVCGDGRIVAGLEGCDDGNAAAGDGCAPDCVVEPGYACTTAPAPPPAPAGALRSVCSPLCGVGCSSGGAAAAWGAAAGGVAGWFLVRVNVSVSGAAAAVAAAVAGTNRTAQGAVVASVADAVRHNASDVVLVAAWLAPPAAASGSSSGVSAAAAPSHDAADARRGAARLGAAARPRRGQRQGGTATATATGIFVLRVLVDDGQVTVAAPAVRGSRSGYTEFNRQPGHRSGRPASRVDMAWRDRVGPSRTPVDSGGGGATRMPAAC